jgi:plastocyanin
MISRSFRVLAATAAIGIIFVPSAAHAGGGGHCGPEVAASAEPGTVSISDNCFTPEVLQVNAGETVRWLSTTTALHTVTFRDVGSGDVLGDFEAKFNRPGTYAYECVYHPGMVAAITVVGREAAGAPIELLEEPLAYAGTPPIAETASAPVGAIAEAAEIRVGSQQVHLNVDFGAGLAIAAGLLVVGLMSAGASTLAVRQARR